VRPVSLLAAATAALAITAGSPAKPADTASIRVVNLAPFTVVGSRFAPAERVRLVVRVRGSRRKRTVDTTARGSLHVVFRKLRVRDCQPYSVRAVGSRGNLAATKNPPAECGPPPAP
jgi:hypothetical protein